MIFQNSCKHRIAVSFTIKQKRSLQLSVQSTLRFQVSRFCNNFSLTSCVTISHSSTAFSQFLGSNGTDLPLFDSILTFSAASIHNHVRLWQDDRLAYSPMLSFSLRHSALCIFRYIKSITNHFRVR